VQSPERHPVDSFPKAVESIIDSVNPEVIVVDWNMLQWASNIRWPKVPRVLVTNIFLTKTTPHTATEQDIAFSNLRNFINISRQRRHLHVLENATDLYEADHVCLADPYSVTQLFSETPDHYLQTGATFLDLYQGDLENLNQISDILLISLGSLGRITVTDDMVNHLKKAGNCQATFLMGKNHSNLKSIDFAFPFVPLKYLLNRSKLVLTHGGTGSTYQALSQGSRWLCILLT